MELKDTSVMMCSEDYKEQFKAEYLQTKLRYEKLKKLNTTIEAAGRALYHPNGCRIEMPTHVCPEDLLREQQRIMGEYLHILELRAVFENIDLYMEMKNEKKE